MSRFFLARFVALVLFIAASVSAQNATTNLTSSSSTGGSALFNVSSSSTGGSALFNVSSSSSGGTGALNGSSTGSVLSSSSSAPISVNVNSASKIMFFGVYTDSTCQQPFALDQSWNRLSSLPSSAVQTFLGNITGLSKLNVSCKSNPMSGFTAGRYYCASGFIETPGAVRTIVQSIGADEFTTRTCDTAGNFVDADVSYDFFITSNVSTSTACAPGSVRYNNQTITAYANWGCNFNEQGNGARDRSASSLIIAIVASVLAVMGAASF